MHAAVPLFRVSEFVKVNRIASGGSSESCPVLGRGTRGDCTETESFLGEASGDRPRHQVLADPSFVAFAGFFPQNLPTSRTLITYLFLSIE